MKGGDALEMAVVRHGEWIDEDEWYYAHCSECGFVMDLGQYFHYCPNCGAKMDGKDSGEDVRYVHG